MGRALHPFKNMEEMSYHSLDQAAAYLYTVMSRTTCGLTTDYEFIIINSLLLIYMYLPVAQSYSMIVLA